MTATFVFQLTCPKDGSDVSHVTQGRPAVTSTRAVVHCDTCREDFIVLVELVPVKIRPFDMGPYYRAAEAEKTTRDLVIFDGTKSAPAPLVTAGGWPINGGST